MTNPHVDLSKGIVKSIANIWADHEWEDFQVEMEGETISCHSLVLAACSGFFRGLLRSGLKECKERCVHLRNISLKAFKLILETLYTGGDLLTLENVYDVWHAADQLQILFMIEHCEQFFCDNLSTASFEYIYDCEHLIRSKNILNIFFNFLLKNFTSIIKTNVFLSLQYQLVHDIIKDSRLIVDTEDVVLYSIYKWVEHGGQSSQPGIVNSNKDGKVDSRLAFYIGETVKDYSIYIPRQDSMINMSSKDGRVNFKDKNYNKDTVPINDFTDNIKESVLGQAGNCTNFFPDKLERTSSETNSHELSLFSGNKTNNVRAKYLSSLLGASRLCLATPSCLFDIVSNEVTQSQPSARSLILQAIAFQVPNYLHGFWPKESEHRNCSDLEHVVVIYDQKSCEALSLRQFEWFKMPQRMYEIDNCKLMVHNKELYSCDNRVGSPFCSIRVLEGNTWKELKRISGQNFHLLAHNKFIYLLKSDEDKIFMFDPKERQTSATAFIAPVSSPTYALSYQGKILIFYSTTKNNAQSTLVYCWDTTSNTWSKLENFNCSGKSMTSFCDSQNVYILESNGSLWKLFTRSDVIGFTFLKKIWNYEYGLRRAFLYGEALYVFGKSLADETGEDDVYAELFTHVQRCEQGSEGSDYVYFVYPKKYFKEIKRKTYASIETQTESDSD